MSIVAEFTIPPTGLPGGETLVETDDVRIEIERIVPTEESAMPFFWVWGPDPEAFIDALEGEPDVAAVNRLDHVDEGALFRAEWLPQADVIQGIKHLDAVILEAEGTADQWRFEVRTEDRQAFSRFQTLFREQGIDVELRRVYELDELVDGATSPLTPVQRETLLTAYREGYFEQPRQVTQSDLADRFGVSRRAISDRLRRATANLVATSLLPSGDST